jgi:hypothetical protein
MNKLKCLVIALISSSFLLFSPGCKTTDTSVPKMVEQVQYKELDITLYKTNIFGQVICQADLVFKVPMSTNDFTVFEDTTEHALLNEAGTLHMLAFINPETQKAEGSIIFFDESQDCSVTLRAYSIVDKDAKVHLYMYDENGNPVECDMGDIVEKTDSKPEKKAEEEKISIQFKTHS